MSGFRAPFSSSPLPSTPDRRANSAGQFFGMPNPSTTPAGPPPSSAGSFTPAGPPPSSVLGSSIIDGRFNSQPFPPLHFSKETASKPANSQNNSESLSSSLPPHNASTKASPRSPLNNEYKAHTDKQKFGSFSADVDEDDGDDEGDEEDEMEEDQYREHNHGDYDYSDEVEGNMEDAVAENGYYDDIQNIEDPRFQTSSHKSRYVPKDHSSSKGSNLLGHSREEDLIDFRRSMNASMQEPRKDFMFAQIAKDLFHQMDKPTVKESDEIVIGTENLIIRLYEEGIRATEDEDVLTETLTVVPTELMKIWADYAGATSAFVSEEYAVVIGPGPRASDFAKSNFLASLLLRLHHPGLVKSPNRPQIRGTSIQRNSMSPSPEDKVKQIPLLLLEWMDDYHDPYPSQLEEIQRHKPSPANHRLFWDTILNSLLRGRVVAVVNALKTAGWRHARNTIDDAKEKGGQVGFTGLALANIEKVVNDAVLILQQCPATRGDWNVQGNDWTLFRLRTDQALENLKKFAEGRNRDIDMATSLFSNGSQSFVGIAKKAESQVPWNIYQNLLAMYNLILGDPSAVIENAQDWCEATIGLAVWWNPGRYDDGLTLSKSRDSVDDAGPETYLHRLTESFYRTIEESTDFQVNTMNPVEVGLASLFEDDVESVMGFLRSWSGPISSAVAEIAALGRWLPQIESQGLLPMDNLDQDDMDLLGLEPPGERVEDIKDQTLIAYASALAGRRHMETAARFGRPKTVREGWEIAIEVLGRLNSVERSEQEVGHLLSDLLLDSGATVSKLWRLLNDLGMTTHAENVAEEYADSLGESSYKYGEALWYYALAHKSKKVKDVLDLLISFSLIHSLAYPPESDLDDYLRRFISSPKSALTEISKLDFEAAQLLQKMLSGYATLRKYYDLRDEEAKLPTGEKPKHSAHARKSEAATALLAVITSADDNIRGGLYDEARGAVVSVDFLLVLLGEAMVYVNQSQLSLTPSHIITLLKAIEDLQTVSARVYGACNEFFQTVMASAPGLKGSSPMDLLRKSTSSMSGTSSFSLVGSSMAASQLKRSMGNSGVMVQGNVKRGWDWRRGLSANTTSDDVLKILRFGLAKDLAKAWILEADGQL